MQVLLKANICWWKNILVFVEEYFGLWSNKSITITYPLKLNEDIKKHKQKPIKLRAINIPLNRDVDSQYGLMFKNYKNGR